MLSTETNTVFKKESLGDYVARPRKRKQEEEKKKNKNPQGGETKQVSAHNTYKSKFDFTDLFKAKTKTINGVQYYAEGKHAGKKVGTVRTKGKSRTVAQGEKKNKPEMSNIEKIHYNSAGKEQSGKVMWWSKQRKHGIVKHPDGHEVYVDSSVTGGHDLPDGANVKFHYNHNIKNTLAGHKVKVSALKKKEHLSRSEFNKMSRGEHYERAKHHEHAKVASSHAGDEKMAEYHEKMAEAHHTHGYALSKLSDINGPYGSVYRPSSRKNIRSEASANKNKAKSLHDEASKILKENSKSNKSESKKVDIKLDKHIPKGYKTMSGSVLSDSEVDAYNRATDKINEYKKQGKNPPENILNGRHNILNSNIKNSISEKSKNTMSKLHELPKNDSAKGSIVTSKSGKQYKILGWDSEHKEFYGHEVGDKKKEEVGISPTQDKKNFEKSMRLQINDIISTKGFEMENEKNVTLAKSITEGLVSEFPELAKNHDLGGDISKSVEDADTDLNKGPRMDAKRDEQSCMDALQHHIRNARYHKRALENHEKMVKDLPAYKKAKDQHVEMAKKHAQKLGIPEKEIMTEINDGPMLGSSDEKFSSHWADKKISEK